jgi:hypothetical protein
MTRWVAAALLASVPAFAACPPTLEGTRIASPRHEIVFAALPAAIPLAEPFAFDIELCVRSRGTARLAKVDADMPEHRHGMNYAPSLIDLGAGRYRAEGFVFHMPGRWRLRFEVDGEILEASLTVE